MCYVCVREDVFIVKMVVIVQFKDSHGPFSLHLPCSTFNGASNHHLAKCLRETGEDLSHFHMVLCDVTENNRWKYAGPIFITYVNTAQRSQSSQSKMATRTFSYISSSVVNCLFLHCLYHSGLLWPFQ